MRHEKDKKIKLLKNTAAVLTFFLLVLICILIYALKINRENHEKDSIDHKTENVQAEKTETEQGSETEENTKDESITEEKEEVEETAVSEETETEEIEEVLKNIVKPEEKYVKFLGRTSLNDGTLWLTYSGTGAAFHFTGKWLKITFCGDTTSEENYSDPDSQARIAVLINGECVFDEIMTKPELYYEKDFKEQCEVDVEVIKLSETVNSTAGIQEIEMDPEGRIVPAKKKDRYIEFIGDSIVCAYGVDDPDPAHKFSTRTENILKSYAYKTAELCDADYSMVCCSGYGLYSGYVSSVDVINTEETMPHYYDKLAYSREYYKGKRPQDIPYTESRGADYVVVNLGTNDKKYVDNREERKQEFRQCYSDFLESIRKYHPKAHIICTLGIMGDELFPEIEKAAQEYKDKTGDEKISCFKFDPMLPENGYAANGHPSEKNQERAAEQLTKYICGIS